MVVCNWFVNSVHQLYSFHWYPSNVLSVVSTPVALFLDFFRQHTIFLHHRSIDLPIWLDPSVSNNYACGRVYPIIFSLQRRPFVFIYPRWVIWFHTPWLTSLLPAVAVGLSLSCFVFIPFFPSSRSFLGLSFGHVRSPSTHLKILGWMFLLPKTALAVVFHDL